MTRIYGDESHFFIYDNNLCLQESFFLLKSVIYVWFAFHDHDLWSLRSVFHFMTMLHGRRSQFAFHGHDLCMFTRVSFPFQSLIYGQLAFHERDLWLWESLFHYMTMIYGHKTGYFIFHGYDHKSHFSLQDYDLCSQETVFHFITMFYKHES